MDSVPTTVMILHAHAHRATQAKPAKYTTTHVHPIPVKIMGHAPPMAEISAVSAHQVFTEIFVPMISMNAHRVTRPAIPMPYAATFLEVLHAHALKVTAAMGTPARPFPRNQAEAVL